MLASLSNHVVKAKNLVEYKWEFKRLQAARNEIKIKGLILFANFLKKKVEFGVMRKTSISFLENDGIIEQFYHLLWVRDPFLGTSNSK